VSPGAIGAFGANHALRQAMVVLDIIMLQQPEMYIGGVAKLLDKDGNVDQSTSAFLKGFVERFMRFVRA
jgi:chromate reductase